MTDKVTPRHIEYGSYLYESNILAAIFAGEQGGLEKLAIVRASFELVERTKIPTRIQDRMSAVDYLTEIGVLRREGELYHYEG